MSLMMAGNIIFISPNAHHIHKENKTSNLEDIILAHLLSEERNKFDDYRHRTKNEKNKNSMNLQRRKMSYPI